MKQNRINFLNVAHHNLLKTCSQYLGHFNVLTENSNFFGIVFKMRNFFLKFQEKS